MFKNLFGGENETDETPVDPITDLQKAVAKLSRDIKQSKKKKHSFLLPFILLIVGLLGIAYFFGVDFRKTFISAKTDVSQAVRNVSLPVSGNTISVQYDSQIEQYKVLLESKENDMTSLQDRVDTLSRENDELRAQQDLQKKKYEAFLLLQNAQMLEFISAQISPPASITPEVPVAEVR